MWINSVPAKLLDVANVGGVYDSEISWPVYSFVTNIPDCEDQYFIRLSSKQITLPNDKKIKFEATYFISGKIASNIERIYNLEMFTETVNYYI